MDIYFLRHASAGEPKMNPAKDDERKLDKEGIEQSHSVGHALAALKINLDAIITSPLPRASQTAAIVSEEIGYKNKLLTDAALKPGATYDDFQELLQRHSGEDAIMVVGHNPSMTEFLNKLLMGDSAPDAVELKKAAIAKVEKDGRRQAILKWCMPPKIVRALQPASAKSSRPKTVSK